MAINLLEKRRKKTAYSPINLLQRKREQIPEGSYYDMPEDAQQQAESLASQQISDQYPDMPDWLKQAVLSMTPRDKSPMLGSAARGISDVTNYIPAVAGGLLQGASIPIRGVASTIPTDLTQRLAQSPDLTSIFGAPQTGGQQGAQTAAEFAGSLGPLGKLFGSLKSGAQLARVPKSLQNATALAGTGYLGTPGDSDDKLLGAAGALALGGAGKVGGKVVGAVKDKIPSLMRGLTSKSTPEELVKAVQSPHDALQSTADELYGQVRSAIKKRDIKIPVNDVHLEKVKEILPKTRATEKLIERAKSGDYDAVHDLQSHLYKKGTKGLASDDIALENQGEEILDLRDKINDDLESHLLKEGHIDVAHVLKQGKKTVANLKNTYFAPLLRKGVGKMVQSDLRLVPENPEKLFGQNSVPMKDFLTKHPEAEKHVQGIKEKKKAIKDLKKLFLTTGVGGGATAGIKSIYDLLK